MNVMKKLFDTMEPKPSQQQQQVQAIISDFVSELETTVKAMKEFKTQAWVKESPFDAAKVARNTIEEHVDKAYTTQKRLCPSIESTPEVLQELEHEKTRLKQNLKDLQKETYDLKSVRGRTDEQITQLKQELQKKQAISESSAQIQKEMEEDLSQYKQDLNDAKVRIETLREDIRLQSEKCEQQHTEKCIQDHQSKQDPKAGSKDKEEFLEQKIAGLQQELRQYNDLNAQLRQENEGRRTAEIEALEKIKRLEEELEKWKQDARQEAGNITAGLKQEKKRLEADNAQYKTWNTDIVVNMKQQIEDSCKAKKELSDKIKCLEEELEKYKHVVQAEKEARQEAEKNTAQFQQQIGKITQDHANLIEQHKLANEKRHKTEKETQKVHYLEADIVKYKQAIQTETHARHEAERNNAQLQQQINKNNQEHADLIEKLKIEKENRHKTEKDTQKVHCLEADIVKYKQAIQTEKNARHEAEINTAQFQQQVEKEREINFHKHEEYKSLQNRFVHTEKKYKQLLRDTQQQLASEKRAKEEALTRISEMMGRRLKENNANIADLGDENRPTKIADMFAELYSNEWTNAFENLLQHANMEEREAIGTLYQTVLDVYQFCTQCCEQQRQAILRATCSSVAGDCLHKGLRKQYDNDGWEIIHSTENSSIKEPDQNHDTTAPDDRQAQEPDQNNDSTPPGDRRAQEPDQNHDTTPPGDHQAQFLLDNVPEEVNSLTKQLQKKSVSIIIPKIQELYVSNSDMKTNSAIREYVRNCVHLCCLMVVQDPPMVLLSEVKESLFDRNLWREFTRTGRTVEYVVWPALLVQKEGALLSKGVVQLEKEAKEKQEKWNQ